MSYDIMKYLSFGIWVSERELTKRLMYEMKYLIRTHQWNIDDIWEPWRQSPHREDGYTKSKTFFIHYKGKEMLVVILYANDQWYSPGYGFSPYAACVFSDDYVYTSRPVSFEKLWSMNLLWDNEIFNHISRYHAKHPQAGLAVYLDRYKQRSASSCSFEPVQMNFLLPLFAQYHKGLELLVKSELYHLAKTMFLCDSGEESLLTKDPGTYRNLKEWLGVSHNILKKLDQMLENVSDHGLFQMQFRGKGWWYVTGRSRKALRPLTNQEFFARLSDIADYNSEYFNLSAFTPFVLQFFMENHLIHHKPVRYKYQMHRYISGVARMKDLQILKVIRYITELPGKEVRDYMKYLNYCGKCKSLDVKEYPFGLKPKDTFHAAAKALDMYEDFYGTELSRNFRSRVKAADYQFLKSDKDNDEKEDYCVSVPQKAKDLVLESNSLGHCVKDYCEEVANGGTYILFLRRADNPDKPFVTMEVSKRYELVQVKARGNAHAALAAQNYVRKWARQKKITIDTNDLSESA